LKIVDISQFEVDVSVIVFDEKIWEKCLHIGI
jgi:hypothetical protein